jgi:hypothetical protein
MEETLYLMQLKGMSGAYRTKKSDTDRKRASKVNGEVSFKASEENPVYEIRKMEYPKKTRDIEKNEPCSAPGRASFGSAAVCQYAPIL